MLIPRLEASFAELLLFLLAATSTLTKPTVADSTPNGSNNAGKPPRPRQQYISKGTVPELGIEEDIYLHPEVQHIPLDPSLKDLRPPPPRLLPEAQRTFYVGTSAFRDGYRCGKTVFTALSRASNPERVRIGIVDQVFEDDIRCVDAYCERARRHWNITTSKKPTTTTSSNNNINDYNDDCPYRSNIRVNVKNASESRGPIVARHHQQQLLQDEEFCLQVDCHSIFTNDWDKYMVEDWQDVGNEMAVLTTYPHNIHNFVNENGDNNRPSALPYICGVKRGARGLVRNKGATLISNMKQVQLGAFYGAGFVFSKCHAEKRVPIDPNSLWIFDGEEFSRSSQLWTAGYDMYAPTGKGLAVYHNYTAVPVRYFSLKVDPGVRNREEEMGANRVKLHIGMEFAGNVNTSEYSKYFSNSKVRTLEQYFNFSSVPVNNDPWPNNTCKQLHWVPYSYPEDVEKLLPGWTLYEPEIQYRNNTVIETRNVTVVEKEKCLEGQQMQLPDVSAPMTAGQAIQVVSFVCVLLILVIHRRSANRADVSLPYSPSRQRSSTDSLSD